MLLKGEAGDPDPKAALPLLVGCRQGQSPGGAIPARPDATKPGANGLVPVDIELRASSMPLPPRAACGSYRPAGDYRPAAAGSTPGPERRLARPGDPECHSTRGNALTLAQPAGPSLLILGSRQKIRMRDPYETLGVSRTAERRRDQKKAFAASPRSISPTSMRETPLRRSGSREISGAYDILGDKDKRAQFDAGAIGADGNPRGFDPRAGGGFRQGNPFGGGGFTGGSGGFKFSFDEQPRRRSQLRGYLRRPDGRRPPPCKGAGGKRRGFSAAVTVSFAESAGGDAPQSCCRMANSFDVKDSGRREGWTGGAHQGPWRCRPGRRSQWRYPADGIGGATPIHVARRQ